MAYCSLFVFLIIRVADVSYILDDILKGPLDIVGAAEFDGCLQNSGGSIGGKTGSLFGIYMRSHIIGIYTVADVVLV